MASPALSSQPLSSPYAEVHSNNSAPSGIANGQNAQSPPTRKLRVAVVGSGLAGLSVAHLLSSLHLDNGHGEKGIEVELFEKAHKLAGRDNGDPNHEHVEGRMDVPMRTFFPEYYPNLLRLYRSIGVQFHDADNTLACFDVALDEPSSGSSDDASSTSSTSTRSADDVIIEDPYLSSRSYKVSSDHTITLPDLPLFSIRNPYPFGRRLLGYYRIARDYVKMLTVSKEFMTQGRMMEIGKDPSEWGDGRLASLREFLVKGGYSHDFSAFFVPLFACVCTCSFDRMMEFPACVILEYVARCMPFGRMQFVSSGVREVADNLSKNIDTIHYNTMIEKIETDSTSPDERSCPIVLVDSRGVRREFDHVIFATQANQAAATLAGQKASKPLPKPYITSIEKGADESNYGRKEEHDVTDPVTPKDVLAESFSTKHLFYDQIKTLTKFAYERTQVVCHTDTSFLPKDQASWRLLNIAKSTVADILASPLDKISAELEQHQLLQQQGSTTTGYSSNSNSSELKNRKKGHDSGISSPEKLSGSSTPTSTASLGHNSAMATHIMNSTALSLGTTTKFLQTTNPIFQPRPETVISSAWFERAVVTPESVKAVDELNKRMDEQSDRLLAGASTSISDRVWFVGSYAYPGIPLLEGCVVTSAEVMERIIAAEPSYKLDVSVSAPKGSFLKRDEPMRKRRLERKQDMAQNPIGDNSASAVYYKTAWKDTLEDERIWNEQEKEAAAALATVKTEKSHFSSSVGSWTSNVYVEVAWMLLLYLAAIVQWWMVFMLESAGFDGSRWALA
ncbi:hypothetical protein BGX31_005059 [Mortierella sp. GBA43]|nr:hypothetical protein BGX31_005059 [Mortierella sp. GBA43]